ncbi:MAG: hypothetical protein AVDCRST_MAG33-953, partial [uncultured Thermomicrobiales bacterium]
GKRRWTGQHSDVLARRHARMLRSPSRGGIQSRCPDGARSPQRQSPRRARAGAPGSTGSLVSVSL